MGKIRGIHSSPGIYTKFTDISYAAKTLGVTTLGVVGETLKGPAFEPIAVSSWTEYTQYFGGKSPVKYEGSKYPRYELPYIAESFLSASDQMYVCRVLGLSGYNAGPAFIVTAQGSGTTKYIVAVLRSRGKYSKYVASEECGGSGEYDKLNYFCDYVSISAYTPLVITGSECSTVSASKSAPTSMPVNKENYGRFTLTCRKGGSTGSTVGTYSVSLNPTDKDYIYNVLGSDATEGPGKSAIYVEELYDNFLQDLIYDGKVSSISSAITIENPINVNVVNEPVIDFVTKDHSNLKRSDFGKQFLCNIGGSETNGFKYVTLTNGVPATTTTNGKTSVTLTNMVVGGLYKVDVYKDGGKNVYCYVQIKPSGTTSSAITVGSMSTSAEVGAVKVLSYNRYFCKNSGGTAIQQVEDPCDYKEEFRCAMTPWIVSDIQGDANNAVVRKMFRFYTISDGNSSNSEVKVSITNINTEDGTFNVLVRDFYDNDNNISILEAYKNVNMIPGDKNYIGLKIGTVNGDYPPKSKYILVETIENERTEKCVPCGFLGYPMRNYNTTGLTAPSFTYNRTYISDISTKKQYFGMSDITGVDVDLLNYKGKYAYTEQYNKGYTPPFHLDSRLCAELGTNKQIVSIDGDASTSGITWVAVSVNNVLPEYENVSGNAPVMSTPEDMDKTIYSDINLRKFTVCFYGGFDGWDIYRSSRTTSNDFKASKYKGKVGGDANRTFSVIDNPEAYALSGRCITSDYYAFLGCISQFENPEKYPINLFATPGIDYVNDLLLVNDTFDMLDEKNVGALYVVTTPDKPFGAEDDLDKMYKPSDVAENLLDSEIDTYLGATYYPWVQYYDADNYKCINLPATKDVLRNMADVDNKKYPWYAPAGLERGDVKCVKAHMFTKLEDEDTIYDERINPIKTFSKDGVKVWGNKTMYSNDTPMNRVNVVRLMLYMRKLIIESSRKLIFDPNDPTLRGQFERIVKPILEQIQKDRGITAFRLDVSQTVEQMDAHELSCVLWVKPTPTLEYIEINFMVTPQGVEFDM